MRFVLPGSLSDSSLRTQVLRSVPPRRRHTHEPGSAGILAGVLPVRVSPARMGALPESAPGLMVSMPGQKPKEAFHEPAVAGQPSWQVSVCRSAAVLGGSSFGALRCLAYRTVTIILQRFCARVYSHSAIVSFLKRRSPAAAALAMALLSGLRGKMLAEEANPSAGPATNQLSIEWVMIEVLRNNPSLQAARSNWEALKSRIPQARAWQDPRVGVDVERYGTT